MDKQHSDIVVVGAGMAGLSCAVRLTQPGLSVRVLDKGRGPGGRMAARRTEIAGETISFDHGAQFFTARDAGFQAAVSAWEADGFVAQWPAAEEAAGEDAWVGAPGMNGPIRAMANGVDVHWCTRAMSLSHSDGNWVVDADGETFTAQTVLVAVPAEQAGELLADCAPDLSAIAAGVESEPCWAVMAGFAQPLAIGRDTLRDPDARIAWAARNSAKPARTGTECWVLHASPIRSREILDLTKDEAGPALLADFFAQTNLEPSAPIHLAAHRWLYAKPAAISGGPARFDTGAQIGIAGDYLHSPRVEGAWLSGTALAELVLNERG